jgi:hypothetical protein
MLPMTLKLPSIKLLLPSLLLVFSLSGCELLNEEINECINKIRPKLPPKILVQGQVGVPYFESIQAQLKNADDDAFNYEFSLDSGSLPPDVGYGWDGRLLKFTGAPAVAGTYKFTMKVRVLVSISGPGDGICFGKDYDKQEYEIVVLE